MKGSDMDTTDKVKSKLHPWRKYGAPISKQWGAEHKIVKPTPEKKVKTKE